MEARFPALIRFDAVMTAAITFLADFIYTIVISASNTSRRTCSLASYDRWMKTNKGGAIPLESKRRMKPMLPVATLNVLSFCHDRFCIKFANALELGYAKILESWGQKITWTSRIESTLSGWRCPIPVVTIYAWHYVLFEISFAPGWEVPDCYILHSGTLNGLFLPFNFLFPLAAVYDSSKDQDLVDLVVTKNISPQIPIMKWKPSLVN